MKHILIISIFIINFIPLSNASEILPSGVDTRKIDIADLKIPGGIVVLARVCCVEEERFRNVSTWDESKPFVLTLKIRMSLGSQIQIYDRKTDKDEVFSCEKKSCQDNRTLLEVYKDTNLNKNINEFFIRYYCGGNIRESKVGGKGADFIGILVLKGQVKVDDTSDEPIWCMDKNKEAIWTVDNDQKNRKERQNGLRSKDNREIKKTDEKD